jgi:hypothetical protein
MGLSREARKHILAGDFLNLKWWCVTWTREGRTKMVTMTI